MELTKGDSHQTEESGSEALLQPSSFNPDVERQELQRALMPQNDSQEVVATAIPISSATFVENNIPVATATAMTTAPMSSVQVPTQSTASTKAESLDKEEGITVESLPATEHTTSTSLPDAQVIKNYTSNLPATQQHTTASLLRQAQHKGQVESEIEKTKDYFAKIHTDAERNETTAAVRVANAKAMSKAWRHDEGLTVDEGIHRRYANEYSRGEENETSEEVVRPYGSKSADGKRGYEVAEYDTAEYDTADYDVTEYKSVYD